MAFTQPSGVPFMVSGFKICYCIFHARYTLVWEREGKDDAGCSKSGHFSRLFLFLSEEHAACFLFFFLHVF